MRVRLQSEWRGFLRGCARLNPQTATVLILYGVFVLVHFRLGGRGFFLTHVAPDASGLLSWVWWFAVQGVTGFLLPALVLCVVFRQRPAAVGLGLGDWRLALIICALYIPLVIVGTWFLSDSAEFQASYPHLRDATLSWRVFVLYHGAFLMYWLGWEYLWRGFVLFGTAHTFGLHALFIQAVPFALLHVHKPLPELVLSMVGGLALGVLVWRCRSFWIAVPIHAVQMLVLDLWCTLRVRNDIDGIGLEALGRLLRGMHGG
ncbi:MAG: CPBP family intramembrane metalloprotease [Bacteroidota bacterium]|nr:CPBP family intramembrane metalloprotease [Bacteroidota bacterium]MDE2956017.1 CPBP family intramembrane metalloprotease [Bacteroidota bacterium]